MEIQKNNWQYTFVYMITSILIVFVCIFDNVLAATLSPTENNIRQYIISQNSAQPKFLKSIVNINSGTTNISGVMQVGEIVKKELKQLGFKTYWMKEPAQMKRAGTLIAERLGHQGERLLLIAHLDTVFPKDSQFQTFKLKNKSATGPGVIDDKGGVVVLLYTLKALHAVHALDNTTIRVVITGDEEDSGKPTSISRKPLIDAAKLSDIALDFEPSISHETVSIARRGISNWTIKSFGNESHSATIFLPGVGDGAIFEIARMLNSMRAELKGEKYLSFNPGLIIGGNTISDNENLSKGMAFGKENVVSKTALARGDFRFVSEEQKKIFKEKLIQLAKQSLPGTSSVVTFEDGIPAMLPTANNLKLLEKYSKVSIDLDQGAVKPLDSGIRGAGDISYVAGIIPANLAGLGPLGLGTHSGSESIQLNSLPIQTQRAAILIYRLTR